MEQRPQLDAAKITRQTLPAYFCPYCFELVGYLGRCLPRWFHDCKEVPINQRNNP